MNVCTNTDRYCIMEASLGLKHIGQILKTFYSVRASNNIYLYLYT